MEIEALKQKILDARSAKTEKLLKCCDEVYDIARQTDNHELLGFLYFYKGEAYYVNNDIDDMLEYMSKSIPYLSETSQWNLLTRAYNMMAITAISRGNAPVAVDYYLDALECAKKHHVGISECSIHINLGYLYMQNGIYEEAREQFEAAYDICQKSNDQESQLGRIIMIYTNMAHCYMLMGNMAKAGEYVNNLNDQFRPQFKDMDYIYVGCMEAKYYNSCGDLEARDRIIQDILDRLKNPNQFDGPFPILDFFDDLMDLCDLTLDAGEDNICIWIAGLIEPHMENTNIVYMKRRFLMLKMRYYKLHNDMEKYRDAATRLYELFIIMEEESKRMIANMIRIRTALEQVKVQNAKLLEKSETDALTGLANRYRLTEYSQQLMDDCLHEQIPYGIEILDVDYFKEYNDNYGHQAGDNCIKKVAALLSRMQTENIFCARYGGDEFIVIYKGLSWDEILTQAKKLKEDIMNLEIKHEYSKSSSIVTISQGICVAVPNEANKSWDFLHEADNYLYQVKRHSRNGVCIGDTRRMELIV